MRLPRVSLMLAAGVFLTLGTTASAQEPMMVSSCMDFAEPTTFEEVVASPAPASASPAVEEVRPVPAARPVPAPLDAGRLADPATYRSVYRILSTENSCSEFYGGPAKAATAFNQFASRLKRGRLSDPRVALRMTGNYTHYQDHASGAAYRIFEQATLNSNGPVAAHAARMQVGRYPGYTPQARALVLLHELGHLVRGPKGGWLLPNDGNDPGQSAVNTRLVEDHCADQLETIRD